MNQGRTVIPVPGALLFRQDIGGNKQSWSLKLISKEKTQQNGEEAQEESGGEGGHKGQTEGTGCHPEQI